MGPCKSTPMGLVGLTVVTPDSGGVDGNGSSTQLTEEWGTHRWVTRGNMDHWMGGRQSQVQS
eukprot:2514867-Karenia_brevis.AAC.1